MPLSTPLVRVLILASLGVVGVVVGKPAGGLSTAQAFGGEEVSGIQVQNLSPDGEAEIDVRFYRYGGRADATTPPPDGCDPSDPTTLCPFARAQHRLLPLMARNFYPYDTGDPSDIATRLARNSPYAVIASADKPIAMINRTDGQRIGSAVIYSHVTHDTDVVVPLAVNAYNGQTSLISILNTHETSGVTATAELYAAMGDGRPLQTVQKRMPPASSWVFDLGSALGGQEAVRFEGVPTGFIGWIRVRTAPEGTLEIPVVVQSTIQLERTLKQKAVSAFEGMPTRLASDRLFVPLVRRSQDAGGFLWTTGISVVNPSARDLRVTARYHVKRDKYRDPALDPCQSAGSTEETVELPRFGSHVFFQGDGPLPDRCFGSAVIEAVPVDGGPLGEGEGILGVVNDAGCRKETGQQDCIDTAAAYNAFVPPATGAGGNQYTTALPLVRNHHYVAVPQFGRQDWITTGVQAMNLGDGPASVRVTFIDNHGRPVDCRFADGDRCVETVEPGASANFWPGAMWRPTVADEFGRWRIDEGRGNAYTDTALTQYCSRKTTDYCSYGSALVTSDQPLAVIVNDVSEKAEFDMATYSGIDTVQPGTDANGRYWLAATMGQR